MIKSEATNWEFVICFLDNKRSILEFYNIIGKIEYHFLSVLQGHCADQSLLSIIHAQISLSLMDQKRRLFNIECLILIQND